MTRCASGKIDLPHTPLAWWERYAQRADDYRLPQSETARTALAVTVGADGYRLLDAIHHPGAPVWLREPPALQVLRQVWDWSSPRPSPPCSWSAEQRTVWAGRRPPPCRSLLPPASCSWQAYAHTPSDGTLTRARSRRRGSRPSSRARYGLAPKVVPAGRIRGAAPYTEGSAAPRAKR